MYFSSPWLLITFSPVLSVIARSGLAFLQSSVSFNLNSYCCFVYLLLFNRWSFISFYYSLNLQEIVVSILPFLV